MSRSYTASESGDVDSNGLVRGGSSHSPPSSPPRQRGTNPQSTCSTTSASIAKAVLGPPANPASALSPIANRMRERDADAMEKYLLRNRSGSHTSSTDNKSQTGSNYSSGGPSRNGDSISPLNYILPSGASTPRKLRSSVSAAQLRTPGDSVGALSPRTIQVQPESRHRAGTGPTSRPTHSSVFNKTPSISTSPQQDVLQESESYIGPPSQYAQFPDPPEIHATAQTASRRKGFHLISKPLPTLDQHTNSVHRRGMSVTSARGAS